MKQTGARKLLQASLDEFGKLHSTPGAPLEYLGKSLVYQTTGEIEEEIKCFELALRKFPKHPLKPVLVEQLLSRLYECTGKNRKAAFAFSLLSLWHLPHLFSYPEHQAFLTTLEQHLEPLYFLEPFEPKTKYLALQLAFWLNKPLTLIEMFEQAHHDSEKADILLALWHLGHHQLVKEKVLSNRNAAFAQELIPLFTKKQTGSLRVALSLFDQALDEEDIASLERLKDIYPEKSIPVALRERLIWMALLQRDPKKAMHYFKSVSDMKKNVYSSLFFLQGCLLIALGKNKQAKLHLTDITESLYPQTPLLLSHFLLKHIDLKSKWYTQAFFWEKFQLLRQLILYYHCKRDYRKKNQMLHFLRKLAKKQATQ